MKHLVIIASNGKGHGIPAMQLASYLVRDVHESCAVSVVWFVDCSIEWLKDFEHPRLQVHIAQKDKEWAMGVTAESYIDEVRKLLDGSTFGEPDIFVLDFLIVHMPAIKATWPRSSLWLYWTSPLIAMYPMIKNKMQRMEAITIPGFGTVEPTDIPVSGDSKLNAFLKRCMESASVTEGVLVNDSAVWYHPKFLEMVNSISPGKGAWPVVNIGPLCNYDLRREVDSSGVFEWLDSQDVKSVVYVTLGSWMALPKADIIELAKALENCGRPVLWAHRNPEERVVNVVCKSFKPRAEITDETDPKTGLPLDLDMKRMKIVEWVDQRRVLRHKSVGVFLTHCGWNSTLECICFGGLPLIAMPCGADQMIVAKFISGQLRLGPRVWETPELECLNRSNIIKCINEVFENYDAYKARVNHYKGAITQTQGAEITKFWASTTNKENIIS